MKKFLSLVLIALILCLTLCACGKKEPQTGTITPETGFDNAGFTEVVCEVSGTCDFAANSISESNDITWEVYVMDKPFTDAFRYIPQASFNAYADISTAGAATVKKGDCLYIYCSENAFTLGSKDEITAGAELTYTIK